MTFKLATFNVNGIRARLQTVLDWLEEHDPDVLCLQETKCRDEDFPVSAFEGAGRSAVFRGQKGYNGVAAVCRRRPENVRLSFDDGGAESEARFMALDVAGLTIVNTYVPQGRAVSDPAFTDKLMFYERVGDWIAANADPSGRLVWTGDLNVAPGDLDVHDPQKLAGSVCFHPEEKTRLRRIMDWGLSDLFREVNPEKRKFSFWDYRVPNGFKRDIGWRIDHILVTDPLARAAKNCDIDPGPRGREKPSDHTPVWAEFDL